MHKKMTKIAQQLSTTTKRSRKHLTVEPLPALFNRKQQEVNAEITEWHSEPGEVNLRSETHPRVFEYLLTSNQFFGVRRSETKEQTVKSKQATFDDGQIGRSLRSHHLSTSITEI